MPRYGDDQCVQCGGIRVANSPLCADCLVATVNSFAPLYDIAQANLKEFKTMVETCREQLEAALAYGFKKNQENAELKQRVKGLCGKIREVMEDGKNRETEDIGL